METVLAIPAADWSPVIGELVENFGEVARVLDIDPERGLLLREIGSDTRWLADPAKCRPVR